jgi:hypothetical protein
MNQTIDIPASDSGVLRLFALNLSTQILQELDDSAPENLCVMLGLEDLDPTYVELVRISDLEELGLAGYLRDGYGLDEASIGEDRAKLRGLSGHVLIILSLAFRNTATTLEARPDLTLIGRYHTQGPDWSATAPLTSPSAAPYTGPPAKKRPSDAAMSGRIATYALLFIFLFTGAFIWIAS